MGSLQRAPGPPPTAFSQNPPRICRRERTSLVKNRMREICTSGSVRGEGGNILTYSAVTREDGSRGIVDLMFSRNIQLAGSEDREHLVVELKRPDVKIDSEVAAQIESYAFAVADDERFRSVPAKWVFWAVSSDVDHVVARKVSQKDRARG